MFKFYMDVLTRDTSAALPDKGNALWYNVNFLLYIYKQFKSAKSPHRELLYIFNLL